MPAWYSVVTSHLFRRLSPERKHSGSLLLEQRPTLETLKPICETIDRDSLLARSKLTHREKRILVILPFKEPSIELGHPRKTPAQLICAEALGLTSCLQLRREDLKVHLPWSPACQEGSRNAQVADPVRLLLVQPRNGQLREDRGVLPYLIFLVLAVQGMLV